MSLATPPARSRRLSTSAAAVSDRARRLSTSGTAVSEDTLLLHRTPTNSNPMDSIPDLSSKLAETEEDRIAGLKLISDSVAQQRQFAQQEMIFHPIMLAVLVVAFAILYQMLYSGSLADLGIIGTTLAGMWTAVLLSIRWAATPYIEEAERVGTWKWLDQDRSSPERGALILGKRDDIFVTRWGNDIIGSLVMRGVSDITPTSETSKNPPSATAIKHAPVKGLIRGWCVMTRYRRKGVGTALLEDAIHLCEERKWTGPEFASDHANSARPLPRAFNDGFERREKFARTHLEKVKKDLHGGNNGGAGEKKL